MSVVIRKILSKLEGKGEDEKFKEIGQSSASLKIFTSDSLEKRKEEYRKLYETVTATIDKTNPLDKLDEIGRRMMMVEQKIGLECAPYFRSAENPKYAQLLGYWRMAYSYTWNMLQVTKSDVQSMSKKTKKGTFNSPLIDVDHQAERMRRFVEIELFTRALYIMKIAYFSKDVSPEFIFSTYEPSKNQTILRSGVPTDFKSDRGDSF